LAEKKESAARLYQRGLPPVVHLQSPNSQPFLSSLSHLAAIEYTPLDSNTESGGSDVNGNSEITYGKTADDFDSDSPARAATGAAVHQPYTPASTLSLEPAELLRRLAKSLSEQAATGLAELADLWPNLTADDQQALLDHARTMAAMRKPALPEVAANQDDQTTVQQKQRGKSKPRGVVVNPSH
jgi:hypothetical protein